MIFDALHDGRVLSFQVSGLYEGLFVMQDDATHSQWLHYTGECVEGPAVGDQLESYASEVTTFSAFKAAHPDGTITAPTNALWRRVFGWFETYFHPPVLPGMFRRTMTASDRRLSEQTLGLGRNSWPVSAIRTLADRMLELVDGRNRSAAYQFRPPA